MPNWLPIETAPHDGTEILLTDGYYKRTGYWAQRIEAWSIDAVAPMNMPTHWTPLPEPLNRERKRNRLIVTNG